MNAFRSGDCIFIAAHDDMVRVALFVAAFAVGDKLVNKFAKGSESDTKAKPSSDANRGFRVDEEIASRFRIGFDGSMLGERSRGPSFDHGSSGDGFDLLFIKRKSGSSGMIPL
jgi:hypothetical protein